MDWTSLESTFHMRQPSLNQSVFSVIARWGRHSSRAVAIAICVVLGVLGGAGEAAAKWTLVTSPHFSFVGDASEREIRSIAARLEQFRAVVGQVFSTTAKAPPSPTIVLVFQNDRSFTPFKPVFQGKPIAVAGVFTGGEDLNYISVNAEQDSDAYNVIFHEYVHHELRNAYGDVPAWFNEGIAQVYESFSMRGNDAAVLGAPSARILELLQGSRALLPIEELIAVTNGSTRYNQGDERTLFYAQSWALAHYLTFGPRARSGQMAAFLSALSRDVDGRTAFTAAFGPDFQTLERELRAYVHGLTFSSLRLEFDRGVEPVKISAGTALSDDEAEGYLGDLLARLERDEEARSYLRKTLERNPRAVRSLVALGTLEVRAGNTAAALPFLERAAALAPDNASALRAYGRALARYARLGNADEVETWQRAMQVLTRASEIDSADISTLVTLAEVEMASDADPERAVALMQRAVAASPGREEYRLMLAQAIGMAGDYQTAKAQFRQLAERGSRSEIREAALRSLARVERVQRAFESRFGAVDTPSVITTAPPTGVAGVGASGAPAGASSSGAARPPLMRRVRPAERRVFGTLTSVDCLANGVRLRVETPDDVLEMAAVNVSVIEAISYRPGTPSALACGRAPQNLSVFATFIEEPVRIGDVEFDYRSTAVEFLPEGFEPR